MAESNGTDRHQGAWRLIDPERSVSLCDVGAPGYVAALTVDPDGTETYWIADRDLIGENCDHGNENPPHERLGPLPPLIRAKIAQIGAPPAAYWYEEDGRWFPVYLCGRPTKKKRPCRMPVDRDGDACDFHREKPKAQS
jgi:hypothetical protein